MSGIVGANAAKTAALTRPARPFPRLASTVSIRAGSVTNQAVAETFGMKLGG